LTTAYDIVTHVGGFRDFNDTLLYGIGDFWCVFLIQVIDNGTLVDIVDKWDN
jgi:hypothetical protein